jgi:calcium permeable stress-gated cation channel
VDFKYIYYKKILYTITEVLVLNRTDRLPYTLIQCYGVGVRRFKSTTMRSCLEVCSELPQPCKNNRPLCLFWLTPPRSQDIQSQAQSASTPSFEAALVLNAAVFGAELLAFTLLRKKFKSIYEPRSFLTPPKCASSFSLYFALLIHHSKRVSPLPKGLLDWPLAVWRADPNIIREQNGLDAYMFLRFLRSTPPLCLHLSSTDVILVMVKILLPIWIISWVVLLPVTSVGTSMPGRTGLDRFTYGNVGQNATDRYAAHLLLAYLFTGEPRYCKVITYCSLTLPGYILYTLQMELRLFIVTRQRHLISPAHSSTPQANTVLVTGVPSQYLSIHSLTHLFSHVPGGVRRVWLNRDLKDLPTVYDARMAACNKLESAEHALLKTAIKIRKQRGGKEADTLDVELDPGEAERLVPVDQRPTHRLPVSFLPFSLPLIGKKVDSITWARAEIVRTNALLEQARAVVESEGEEPHAVYEDNGEQSKTLTKVSYPPLSSAFILFHQQIGAHMASQILIHGLPLRMADKYIEVAPPDVVWGNLGLNPYEARIRRAVSWALTIGLIIVWAIPGTCVRGRRRNPLTHPLPLLSRFRRHRV